MGLQQTSIRYKDLSYLHYYLCNYLPVSAGKDTLSQSLIRFKKGLQPDLSGWIDCSCEILAAHCPSSGNLPGVNPTRAPSGIVSPSGPIPAGSTIVRALHHDETGAEETGPTSLDQLGRALASRFQCRYTPSLLHKSRLTRQIKGFSRQQREAELRGLYYIDTASRDYDPVRISRKPMLIIDDILTTATTIKMIIGAIRLRFPHPALTVFTLAKADYDPRSNRSTPLKGQNYHLEQGMDWLVAEEPASYYSAEQLKAWIRSGSC